MIRGKKSYQAGVRRSPSTCIEQCARRQTDGARQGEMYEVGPESATSDKTVADQNSKVSTEVKSRIDDVEWVRRLNDCVLHCVEKC